MKYTIWLGVDMKWYWQAQDMVDGAVQWTTDCVGPYETEIQAMVSMLAYAAKVEL
jgi:hypothetical protein